MHKALFLDRDGVINEETGYVHKIEECKFIPGVFEALQLAQKAGYKLIIITNQAGIAKQKFKEEHHHQLMAWMKEQFAADHISIDGEYYCPHHPQAVVEQYRKECDCRKPQPGMILQAAQERNIDVTKSIVIGDKTSDILAGKKAGCKTILVRTGYGGKDEVSSTEPDYVVDDLLAAVKLILHIR